MKLDEKVQIVAARGFMLTDTEAWYLKWSRHHHAAIERGMGSQLTFEQYMDKVQQADLDMPEQIGRSNEQFQLARVGDEGDYRVDNCRFITAKENQQEKDSGKNGWLGIGEWRRNNSVPITDETRKKLSDAVTGRTKENHAGKRIQADKLAKEFVMIAPDGTEHRGKNLFEFCKANGLHQGSTSKVVRGLQDNHKGWKGRYV